VINPYAPQYGHRVSVRIGDHRRVEHFSRRPTYAYQLDAFVAAVRDGAPTLTPPEDSIATMTVIDAIYRAAGLPLRQPTP
jgi:predicted dehydrogenase